MVVAHPHLPNLGVSPPPFLLKARVPCTATARVLLPSSGPRALQRHALCKQALARHTGSARSAAHTGRQCIIVLQTDRQRALLHGQTDSAHCLGHAQTDTWHALFVAAWPPEPDALSWASVCPRVPAEAQSTVEKWRSECLAVARTRPLRHVEDMRVVTAAPEVRHSGGAQVSAANLASLAMRCAVLCRATERRRAARARKNTLPCSCRCSDLLFVVCLFIFLCACPSVRPLAICRHLRSSVLGMNFSFRFHVVKLKTFRCPMYILPRLKYAQEG
jgi:hypothetical protein